MLSAELQWYTARNVRDAAEADDIVQDAFKEFFSLCQKDPTKAAQIFKNRRRLRGYLFGTARNLARESARKRRPLSCIELDHLVAPVEQPGSRVLARERSEKIDRFLSSLSDSDRALLRWHFWDRLSHASIAELLNININAAKARLSRLLKKGRRWMEKQTVA